MSRKRVVLWIAATAFAVTLLGALALFRGYTALQDTDSYYHLALARKIAQEGIPEHLEWARMTSYGERFGDPVLGFHLVLTPFAAGASPERGGLIALALLDAAIFALIAGLAAGAIGRWGLAVPFAVFAGSTEAALRLVRLRPELLALLLLLVAGYLAGRGRYRWLAVVSAVFALSYSAVHAYLAIWGLLFLLWGWSQRRWEWALLLYATLGVGLGLVIHPSFPANLDALAMTFRVGLGGGALAGSGGELRPHTTMIAFLTQLGLWGAFFVVWAARRSALQAGPDDARLRDVFGLLTAVFGALYLMSSRFSLFAFPFAALWLLWTLRARGETVGKSALLFGRRIPAAAALAACALAAAYPLALQVGSFAGRASSGPGGVGDRNREQIAAALPRGAKVAANWGDADLLVFYAPWARYLEVLDPLPMRLARPEAYLAKRRVWNGAERDVPWVVSTILDSDFLVSSRLQPEEAGLHRRLAGDPRIELLHDGFRLLVRWRPGANRRFVRPWHVAPLTVASLAAVPDGSWTPYPWDTHPRGRAVEGLLDLRRLAERAPCRVLATMLPASPQADRWAVAPAGPTRIALAGREVLAIDGALEAILTRAVRFSLPPRATAQTLTVQTCGVAKDDPGGFYFWSDLQTPTEAPENVRPL